jgi:uncharacterized cofD-like protein
MDQTSDKNPINIVTIGGGKGQATILRGLRKYSYRFKLDAIVSMVDNGGSTGRLMEELRIPPFGGDFRDVMTALSTNQTLVDLFHHRYEHGSDVKGHSVGNLILLGLLEKADWNMTAAIKIACEILDISAGVHPSTTDKIHLMAKYESGEIVKGQDNIDNDLKRSYQTISQVYTEPEATGHPEALAAIEQADFIVLCPGDIYGSLLCNLVIPDIKQAISKSKAKIIYITNLMTKINQTHNWKSSRFIAEINKYLPRQIDWAIVNNGLLDEQITGQSQYASESWEMVVNDIESDQIEQTKVIKDKIWFEGQEFKRVSSDVIPRSFIRHDPAKIADIIMGIATA